MKNPRHILLATIVAASQAGYAASFAGIAVPPPPPPRNVADTHFGVTVDDPYRYFEDVKDAGLQACPQARSGHRARPPFTKSIEAWKRSRSFS